jgi:hypothetical protein
MKIKTKALSYEQVMALPRPAHKPPQKPSRALGALIRLVGAGDLKETNFIWRAERMEELGPGPYLILMNHSSFIDLKIASVILWPRPFNIICTSDGFVGKAPLMRAIGCIPTRKFLTDVTLVRDMNYAVKKLRSSILMYPEASYTFDGSPTPLLRGRLDRALDFAKAQEAETGKAPVFVLSGGRGPNECVSEAESMRRCLAEQGVPAERMLLEDRSTDTAENMAFSKKLIQEAKPDAVIAFSTSNYHVFRSGLKARRVKMRALGMGCRSKWYFWPNAAVREFVGLLTQHRGKQGLILGALIVAYVVLTYFQYQLF